MTLDDLMDLSAGDDQLDLDIKEPKQKKQHDDFEVTPYNPFVSRPSQQWDDRIIDRMLTIKRPEVESGTIWITDAGFAETLSLLPLNKMEQMRFWKKFRKIQMVATGELNKRIVDSRQDRLMMELVSQKSRLDVAVNGNMNEREQWNTNKQIIEQTLKTPSPQPSKGFVSSVVGGLTGR
jgi:hypothetical protein